MGRKLKIILLQAVYLRNIPDHMIEKCIEQSLKENFPATEMKIDNVTISDDYQSDREEFELGRLRRSEKFISSLICIVIAFAIGYLVVGFTNLELNIVLWPEDDRAGALLVALVAFFVLLFLARVIRKEHID